MKVCFLVPLVALAMPALAQSDATPAPLTLEQKTALRCSAAFAIGATLQARGEFAEWPPLAEDGREYFVRVSARLMDQTGRTREQVAEALTVEARELRDRAALEAAMRPCLMLLDASGV